MLRETISTIAKTHKIGEYLADQKTRKINLVLSSDEYSRLLSNYFSDNINLSKLYYILKFTAKSFSVNFIDETTEFTIPDFPLETALQPLKFENINLYNKLMDEYNG